MSLIAGEAWEGTRRGARARLPSPSSTPRGVRRQLARGELSRVGAPAIVDEGGGEGALAHASLFDQPVRESIWQRKDVLPVLSSAVGKTLGIKMLSLHRGAMPAHIQPLAHHQTAAVTAPWFARPASRGPAKPGRSLSPDMPEDVMDEDDVMAAECSLYEDHQMVPANMASEASFGKASFVHRFPIGRKCEGSVVTTASDDELDLPQGESAVHSLPAHVSRCSLRKTRALPPFHKR